MPEIDTVGIYSKTTGAIDHDSIIGHSKCNCCGWSGWTQMPSICPKCGGNAEWIEPKPNKLHPEVNMLCLDEEGKKVYYDDVSGAKLPADKVEAARREEKKHVSNHHVYEKVPLTMCYAKTGKAPIKTKWIDINRRRRKSRI